MFMRTPWVEIRLSSKLPLRHDCGLTVISEEEIMIVGGRFGLTTIYKDAWIYNVSTKRMKNFCDNKAVGIDT
jgi:hypothetical protein